MSLNSHRNNYMSVAMSTLCSQILCSTHHSPLKETRETGRNVSLGTSQGHYNVNLRDLVAPERNISAQKNSGVELVSCCYKTSDPRLRSLRQ